MKFYTTHFIKFSIIKFIYFILRILNFKKFFFENDFEMKKNSFHKENVFEQKLLKSLSSKLIPYHENNIIRQSEEKK